MANCPKCGNKLSVWGNCVYCGYEKGEEEKTEAEKQAEKTGNGEAIAIGFVIALIVMAVIFFLATSTLQINVTGTIKVQ